MTTLPIERIAARVFNRPLALLPEAAHAIVYALSHKTGILPAGDPKPWANRFIGRAQTDIMGRPKGYQMTDDGVAIVPMIGELANRGENLGAPSGITSYEGLTATLKGLAEDPSVRGIVLDINSPGGEVSGMIEVSAMIRAVREVKPVIGMVNDVCCSAAYCIAAQCDHIFAGELATVGHIGTMIMHADISKATAAQGMTVTIVTAGAGKADGHPMLPLAPEMHARLQRQCDLAYEAFLGAVEAGRGLLASAMRTMGAEIFYGPDAVESGLVDAVGSIEGVIADMGVKRPPYGARRAFVSGKAPVAYNQNHDDKGRFSGGGGVTRNEGDKADPLTTRYEQDDLSGVSTREILDAYRDGADHYKAIVDQVARELPNGTDEAKEKRFNELIDERDFDQVLELHRRLETDKDDEALSEDEEVEYLTLRNEREDYRDRVLYKDTRPRRMTRNAINPALTMRAYNKNHDERGRFSSSGGSGSGGSGSKEAQTTESTRPAPATGGGPMWTSLQSPPTAKEIRDAIKAGVKIFDFDLRLDDPGERPASEKALALIRELGGTITAYHEGAGGGAVWGERSVGRDLASPEELAKIAADAKRLYDAGADWMHLDNMEELKPSDIVKIQKAVMDATGGQMKIIAKNNPAAWATVVKKYPELTPPYAVVESGIALEEETKGAKRLAARGVPVYIKEFDKRLTNDDGTPAGDARSVSREEAQQFAKDNPWVAGVIHSNDERNYGGNAGDRAVFFAPERAPEWKDKRGKSKPKGAAGLPGVRASVDDSDDELDEELAALDRLHDAGDPDEVEDAPAPPKVRGEADVHARIKAILTSPAAKGRQKLAEHLAFDERVPLAQALDILAAAPAGSQTIVLAGAGVPSGLASTSATPPDRGRRAAALVQKMSQT